MAPGTTLVPGRRYPVPPHGYLVEADTSGGHLLMLAGSAQPASVRGPAGTAIEAENLLYGVVFFEADESGTYQMG